jgi:DNA-binding NarL/FixJ family response regulator
MSPRYQSSVSYGERNAGGRDYSKATAEQIDEEVRRLLVDAYQLAGTILMADRAKLGGIAKGLLEHETFDRSRIKEIVEDGRLINLPQSGALPRGKKMPAQNLPGLLALTAREMEVLTWIAQGKTNYEIGVILSACTGTICKHVERILSKLCVENRTAAAAIALAALANAKR